MQSASHIVSTSIVVSIIWVLSDSLLDAFGYVTLCAISPALRKIFWGLTPGFPIQSNLIYMIGSLSYLDKKYQMKPLFVVSQLPKFHLKFIRWLYHKN